ncbi:uncharacterized protein LOC143362774 [Halictus rubicundus]|uniref:uncharacterized protein LOC143362774 n=1 Tax=Halictus rubicundus TaxID=77578 RepID=UPI004036F019
MRAIYVSLIFIFAMCVAAEPTVQTRVTRTLPFDFSPSRWTGMFRTLLSGGRLWEWPRNGIEELLRLVATPDTRKKMTFVFRPEDGPRASYDYQRRYGYRGQWLIDLLGSGFHPDAFLQPLPAAILVPPPPPL